MKIEILHLIEGAKKAEGLTVVIDVFRAYSLECYLLSRGAEKIIPVGDKEKAYKLKKENPDYILAGERHGEILPGFDMGNSPSNIIKNINGKTIIHTTSAGTQGIANAVNADEILGCALVNAKATAEYIKFKNPEKVSLVCMGLEALKEAEEDTLCANYIKSLLNNTRFDLENEIKKLKFTTGAKFFDETQAAVFPEEDFHMCTKADIFSFALRFNKENGEITRYDL